MWCTDGRDNLQVFMVTESLDCFILIWKKFCFVLFPACLKPDFFFFLNQRGSKIFESYGLYYLVPSEVSLDF